MKKLIIILLAFVLAGCTQTQDLGGGVITKEFKVKGEKVFVGGEQMLGGDELADFKPEVKLEKWGDETYIKVWSEEKGDKTASQKGDKVIWHNTDKSKEYNFYPIEDGFEYEVILKEKPKTNIISLKIKTKDLVFYYQGELEDEKQENEICHSPDTTGVSIFRDGVEYSYCFIDDDGSTTTSYTTMRPVNVIGSYAVYHATKKGHEIGQTNYMAGKAFHIYRPQITDANGWKMWEDLHIKNGILTITIPQEFLDKAVYPASSKGVNFGYEDIGKSDTTDSMLISVYLQAPGNGSIDSISMYANCFATSRFVYGMTIESDETLATNGKSGSDTNAAAGWLDMTYSTKPSIINNSYYFFGGGSNDIVRYYFDADTLDDGCFDTTYDFTTTNDPTCNPAYAKKDDKFSIYATYTASGGADTCTYSGTGDWNVLYSDNCDATTTTYVLGDFNLIYDSAGSFELYDTLKCDALNGGAGASIKANNANAVIEIY